MGVQENSDLSVASFDLHKQLLDLARKQRVERDEKCSPFFLPQQKPYSKEKAFHRQKFEKSWLLTEQQQAKEREENKEYRP